MKNGSGPIDWIHKTERMGMTDIFPKTKSMTGVVIESRDDRLNFIQNLLVYNKNPPICKQKNEYFRS